MPSQRASVPTPSGSSSQSNMRSATECAGRRQPSGDLASRGRNHLRDTPESARQRVDLRALESVGDLGQILRGNALIGRHDEADTIREQ